ncbi:MAG: hypothetical protein KIT20_02485 [Alphaproteobacteria bacterium]|nr:hypothetical protein [Alphaproteobacteria bacterium]
MRHRILAAAGLGALLLGAGMAQAHHGWGSYDSTRTLTIDGVIQKASYENPHGMIEIKAGEDVWEVVLAPPSRMQNRGLPATALAIGKTVTVVGYQHRTNKAELRAERIIVAGTTTELR